MCWYWAAEQTSCYRWGGGGQASLPRGLETSCWMDADKHHPSHVGVTNKPSPYHRSFILPFPVALFLFGISFMRISGCCGDLVLSVTARSTLIIHFGIFGILFFPPVSPSISALLVTWKGCLKYKKNWQCVRRKHGEEKHGNGNKFYHLIHVDFGDSIIKS